MRRTILPFLFISVLLTTADNAYSYGALVPAEAKEVFIEFYTQDISGRGATNFIGGHYTHYFTEWLAAGPGFTIPPLDWSFFNLGIFIHAYVFPFPDWPIRPFFYLEAGVHFTDLEYTFTDLGVDRPGTLWYWTGFLKPGAGVEVPIFRDSSGMTSARAMVYQHLEFLHMQYFREPAASLNLSLGIAWSFF